MLLSDILRILSYGKILNVIKDCIDFDILCYLRDDVVVLCASGTATVGDLRLMLDLDSKGSLFGPPFIPTDNFKHPGSSGNGNYILSLLLQNYNSIRFQMYWIPQVIVPIYISLTRIRVFLTHVKHQNAVYAIRDKCRMFCFQHWNQQNSLMSLEEEVLFR